MNERCIRLDEVVRQATGRAIQKLNINTWFQTEWSFRTQVRVVVATVAVLVAGSVGIIAAAATSGTAAQSEVVAIAKAKSPATLKAEADVRTVWNTWHDAAVSSDIASMCYSMTDSATCESAWTSLRNALPDMFQSTLETNADEKLVRVVVDGTSADFRVTYGDGTQGIGHAQQNAGGEWTISDVASPPDGF